MYGAAHPASARPTPERGQYMTSGPHLAKRAPLPPDLQEFSAACDFADALATSKSYTELEKWARQAREAVEALRRKARQR